jgi:two-component system nitrate/nitrite response regulator NarL
MVRWRTVSTAIGVLRSSCDERTIGANLKNEIRLCLKNVLIVDDSPAIRRSLRTSLEQRTGWQVCGEAENGQDGVDQALRFNPDLIVLDLSMPVMNGFQAARELQRLLPRIPIVLFTTFSNAQVEREAFAAGVKAVQSKSAGLAPLLEVMYTLLQAA